MLLTVLVPRGWRDMLARVVFGRAATLTLDPPRRTIGRCAPETFAGRFGSLASLLSAWLALIIAGAASAACPVPNQLANGQIADAGQVMGNFNALAGCANALGTALSPAGAVNSLQYNAGGGTFGSVGPLADGQIIVGTSGGEPQIGTITAGPGITVVNGPGSINISAAQTGDGINLWNLGRHSLTAPTAASFTVSSNPSVGSTWSLTDNTDALPGVTLMIPSNVYGDNNANMTQPVPSQTAFTLCVLVIPTFVAWNNFSLFGLSVTDTNGKIIDFGLRNNNSGSAGPAGVYARWNSINSWNGGTITSAPGTISQPVWMKLQLAGGRFTFQMSLDGVRWSTYFVQPATDFLGANLSSVGLMVNGNAGATNGPASYMNVLHWTLTTP